MPSSTISSGRVLLQGISWQTYARMREELDRANRRVRLVYDRGLLEIVTRRVGHEQDRKRLARLVEALTEELGLPLQSGGETTWQREDLRQGIEADECYWIQSADLVRGRREIDIRIGPPPDLAVEIDHASSSLDKLPIYAALGVREVWRFAEDRLTAHVLGPSGAYERVDRSRAFPGIRVMDLGRFVIDARTRDETAWIRDFRSWAREQLPAG